VHSKIDTPLGSGFLEQIYVTELGHVMARIYYKKKGLWVNRRITSLNNFLKGTGIKNREEYKLQKCSN